MRVSLASLSNRKRDDREPMASPVASSRDRAVADALGVARSNLAERRAAGSAARRSRKPEDAALLLPQPIPWIVRCAPDLRCRRDGSVVRVLFAIDACDREVIAWSATTAGVSGEMVRDLMVACVERRFGSTRTRHPVEWLSDNGSAYIAKQTAQTATALGLLLAFTPVRSPESNGVSEAFVKTLKRDYARVTLLPDAETVLRLLPGWIEDYNTVHPHSGLRFLSPREFLALSA